MEQINERKWSLFWNLIYIDNNTVIIHNVDSVYSYLLLDSKIH